ncbi:MAG: efflux RND transporter periplasmic adaptor subunit [Desulfobacterales bacterium]|nr:efflux RND transporter periplasmic adaptor subunit [Desulfobacterales bacterium]
MLVCALIFLAGAGALVLVFFTEPEVGRMEAARETAMLVDVTEVQKGEYRPVIRAMGTVVAEHDVSLQPRVGGEILSRSDDFTPGGFVKKGQVIVEIDPTDYRNSLTRRKSDLDRAVSNLQLEMGRQNVAEQDYRAMGRELSGQHRDLVLRRPQLMAAKADVDDAKAAVGQAELELGRTRVKAPFDARVLSRDADVGSRVSAGEVLGRLVGTKTFWVETTVSQSALPWISFPENNNDKGAVVRIRNRSAWPQGVTRTGRLYRLVGTLAEDTRFARVLVAVDDPLARKADDPETPPLLLQSFVEAEIQGRPIPDVIRLKRDYIRKNNTVWVMKDGKLEIRDVKIVFSDAEHAYVRTGLNDGEKVVTSSLATVAGGAPLRLKDSDDNGNPADGG